MLYTILYINQIKFLGGKVDNHDRLNKETVYSWNPAIDYDKLVNYREYYWIPEGVNAIEIDRDNDKNPVVSLREIASEAVDAESLQERFIRSMQKNLIKEENNIEEEESLEEEFAAYLNETKNEKINDQELFLNKNKNEEDGTFVDISEDLIKNED